MEKLTLNATIIKDGIFWVAKVRELPEAMTQGLTLDELFENLQEVVALALEDRRLTGSARAQEPTKIRSEIFSELSEELTYAH